MPTGEKAHRHLLGKSYPQAIIRISVLNRCIWYSGSEWIYDHNDQILVFFLAIGHLHSCSLQDWLAVWSFTVPITHIFDLKKRVRWHFCRRLHTSENWLDGFCCHLVADDGCYVNHQSLNWNVTLKRQINTQYINKASSLDGLCALDISALQDQMHFRSMFWYKYL